MKNIEPKIQKSLADTSGRLGQAKVNNSKGFTIVELLVAISIFAVISILVINFFVDISRVYMASLSARSAQQNVRSAMDTITRYIKQARSIEESGNLDRDHYDDRLVLKTSDETIKFRRVCENYTSTRADFSCTSFFGSRNPGVGVLKVAYGANNETYQSLTSTDLNIKEFSYSITPGVPPVLNITIRAQIEEAGAGSRSWEQGASGKGEIEMKTSVALKGQYY